MIYTKQFFEDISISDLKSIINKFNDYCISTDRYRNYQGNNTSWNLELLESGAVVDIVIRNNAESRFNNFNDNNDVAMILRKREDSELPDDEKGTDVFEYKVRIINCDPAREKDRIGHWRESMCIGQHEIRPHRWQSRIYIYHEDGIGVGKVINKELQRTAICQRGDGYVPVLRTDTNGHIVDGYSQDKMSWEMGKGFNDHDVTGNSSLGCLTTPRENGYDDLYIHQFRSVLSKATVKDRANVILINSTTLDKIWP